LNIEDISVTLIVLKLLDENVMVESEEHPENIEDMFVTFPVLKFELNVKDDRDVQPENNDDMFVQPDVVHEEILSVLSETKLANQPFILFSDTVDTILTVVIEDK